VLAFDGECCRNSKGQTVLKFSKQFIKQIQPINHKNYKPQYAIIRYIGGKKSRVQDRFVLPFAEPTTRKQPGGNMGGIKIL